jgi:hypothetical protein
MPAADRRNARPRRPAPSADIGGPLIWTFDGPIARALGDLEDALRRAIVQVGDIASMAVLIELSLPSLKRRIDAGDVLQPAWTQLLERLQDRYGLQAPPRVRHVRTEGPLATLVVVYRS